MGVDESLGFVGKRRQTLGRNAGRPEDPHDDAKCSGWISRGGLQGRGYHPMVHRRHCQLQRGNQGIIIIPLFIYFDEKQNELIKLHNFCEASF